MNVRAQPGVGICFVGGPKSGRAPYKRLKIFTFPRQLKKFFSGSFPKSGLSDYYLR
jgi:hypothetical protein